MYTVRELILELIRNHPMDAPVYIGKGMGPLRKVESEVAGNTDRIYTVLSP